MTFDPKRYGWLDEDAIEKYGYDESGAVAKYGVSEEQPSLSLNAEQLDKPNDMSRDKSGVGTTGQPGSSKEQETVNSTNGYDPYSRTRKAIEDANKNWRQMLIDSHTKRQEENRKQVRNAQILGIGKALGDMIGAIWGGVASSRNNATAVVPAAQASKTAEQVERLIREGVVSAKDYDNMMLNLAMQKGKDEIALARAYDEFGLKQKDAEWRAEQARIQREWEEQQKAADRKYNEEQKEKDRQWEKEFRQEQWDHDKNTKKQPIVAKGTGGANKQGFSGVDSPAIMSYINDNIITEYTGEYEQINPYTGISERRTGTMRVSAADQDKQRQALLQQVTNINRHYKIPAKMPDSHYNEWVEFINYIKDDNARGKINEMIAAGAKASQIIELLHDYSLDYIYKSLMK